MSGCSYLASAIKIALFHFPKKLTLYWTYENIDVDQLECVKD